MWCVTSPGGVVVVSALDDLFGATRVDLPMADWDAGVDANGQVFISRGGVTVGLTSALSDRIREGFRKAEDAVPQPLEIMNGWLVAAVGSHTCGGGTIESGYHHEPGCGYEPLVNLAELRGWPGGES